MDSDEDSPWSAPKTTSAPFPKSPVSHQAFQKTNVIPQPQSAPASQFGSPSQHQPFNAANQANAFQQQFLNQYNAQQQVCFYSAMPFHSLRLPLQALQPHTHSHHHKLLITINVQDPNNTTGTRSPSQHVVHKWVLLLQVSPKWDQP